MAVSSLDSRLPSVCEREPGVKANCSSGAEGVSEYDNQN